MKLCTHLLIMLLLAGPASAKVDCEISKVLNESQFYLNKFTDVKDGFSMTVQNHLFSFHQNSGSNIATIRIKDLSSSKEVSASGEIAFGNSLRLNLDDGFRIISSMKCY